MRRAGFACCFRTWNCVLEPLPGRTEPAVVWVDSGQMSGECLASSEFRLCLGTGLSCLFGEMSGGTAELQVGHHPCPAPEKLLLWLELISLRALAWGKKGFLGEPVSSARQECPQ